MTAAVSIARLLSIALDVELLLLFVSTKTPPFSPSGFVETPPVTAANAVVADMQVPLSCCRPDLSDVSSTNNHAIPARKARRTTTVKIAAPALSPAVIGP
jgi:hypothetical protein